MREVKPKKQERIWAFESLHDLTNVVIHDGMTLERNSWFLLAT
jgi:hypothetical protein